MESDFPRKKMYKKSAPGGLAALGRRHLELADEHEEVRRQPVVAGNATGSIL
jgi:hypothetical protein